MLSKANENPIIHQLPAGLLVGDKSTEIFGCRETKQTYFLNNGNTQLFATLPPEKKASIMERLLDDDVAIIDLNHLPLDKAIEKFAFCVFGAADSEPDFDANGQLMSNDNFICSNNCTCLKWKSKSITIDGQPLTPKQLEIIQLMANDEDLCDKQIADRMNIAESTLDTHKTKLFEKFGVNSKPGLVRKAIHQKIVQ